MSYVKSTFNFVVGFICSAKIMNSPKKPLLKRAISLVLWSLNHNNRWFSGYTPIFTDQLFVGKCKRKYYKYLLWRQVEQSKVFTLFMYTYNNYVFMSLVFVTQFSWYFGVLAKHISKNEFIVERNSHSMKCVQIRSFSLSVFSCIRTEYRKMRTRKNSIFGHFSRKTLKEVTSKVRETCYTKNGNI